MEPLALALLVVFGAMALYNLATAPRLERFAAATDGPPVSVCVPARNEALSLARTLPRLLASRYRPLEVLVVDDGSTDDTEAVARAAGARVWRGEPLPEGWLGKNWACRQLAEAARGEILIFCDADVACGPDAVGRTVEALCATGASAVTALPHQQLGSVVERAVLPLVMHVPALTTLPLALLPELRSPRTLVANGQWLAIRREAYVAAGGHAAVRGAVVEDMALARRIVALPGARLVPLLAARDLSVRMYRGARELREGFGKNLYPLVGGTPFAAGMATGVAVLGWVLPWLLPLLGGSAWPLAALVVLRAAVASSFRSGWRSIAWHPLGSILAILLLLDSAVRTTTGRATWKGRLLPLTRSLES